MWLRAAPNVLRRCSRSVVLRVSGNRCRRPCWFGAWVAFWCGGLPGPANLGPNVEAVVAKLWSLAVNFGSLAANCGSLAVNFVPLAPIWGQIGPPIWCHIAWTGPPVTSLEQGALCSLKSECLGMPLGTPSGAPSGPKVALEGPKGGLRESGRGLSTQTGFGSAQNEPVAAHIVLCRPRTGLCRHRKGLRGHRKRLCRHSGGAGGRR